MEKKTKVIIAKLGLDGHTRGAFLMISVLKDAGMEVIYTGLHQTVEMVVQTAIQEDVDVVGASIYSGAHMTQIPKLIEVLKQRGAGDKMVVVGGLIHGDDITQLKRIGVAEVFPVDTSSADVVEFFRKRGLCV